MTYAAQLSGNPKLWDDKVELYKLAHALRSNRIEQYLAAMGAPNPIAHALRQAQAHYMAIEASGGWPHIQAGPPLHKGQSSPRVAALRQRLIATGDLPPSADLEQPFDAALTAAVKHFQKRHGLAADGVIGTRTLQEMNIPVYQRLATIRLSRARAEELPAGSHADYIWVNIAAASTHLVRRQQTVWTGRSVVGKPQTPTPEMHSTLDTLVLNPFWLVPDSIAKRSLLPRAARDSTYLARMQYRAFDIHGEPLKLSSTHWSTAAIGNKPRVRLIQSPGPLNALGKVKFLFPNDHAVFLHDTPNKNSFGKSQRMLSNGCVRVEGAVSLAAMILEPQGWNQQRISQVLSSGKSLKLKLDKPLPVHTLYLRATPRGDGTINFYNDSYGKDTPSEHFASPAIQGLQAEDRRT